MLREPKSFVCPPAPVVRGSGLEKRKVQEPGRERGSVPLGTAVRRALELVREVILAGRSPIGVALERRICREHANMIAERRRATVGVGLNVQAGSQPRSDKTATE